jgi:hypothetical protein
MGNSVAYLCNQTSNMEAALHRMQCLNMAVMEDENKTCHQIAQEQRGEFSGPHDELCVTDVVRIGASYSHRYGVVVSTSPNDESFAHKVQVAFGWRPNRGGETTMWIKRKHLCLCEKFGP